MLQSIFNSRLSIHLIIRHSIYPVGIITRYKLCATTDSQKVELTMKTPLITREGYEKLKQEMDYLWRQERPEVTKKVTWAASLGDRSENADYQYNKKRLREIDRRVRYLTKCLEQLKIVDYSPQQEGKVFFGAWVEIENDEGDIKRFASSVTMKFLAAKTISPSTRRWRAHC
ncbi:transcription elongation factor GreB [Klebsiella pneumoniae]|uniref:Transcription elongation factor GreA n=1 Tax=Klebsiella pneumoniae TaxID=573 RepID=A0A2X3EUV7_KLEPN|nr:transcription elongation factor GreB [Klebsiella pneumoniae]